MTKQLQDTLSSAHADAPFAVRALEPVEPERPAEPADLDESLGWSESEIEYLAGGGLTIPGRGDRSEGCGDYLPLKFCPKCGEPELLEKRCKQRTCPACESLWTGEQAERAAVRLVAAREAEPDGLQRRAVHAVASLPEGEVETITQFRRAGKEAYALAKEKGVRGGVVVPHAYRVNDDVKAAFREVEPEMGIWRWLKDERPEDWRTLVHFSPHFHIVGLAEDVAASDPDADDGWVFKRIRTLERHNWRREAPYEDVYGLLYYLLTHASFDPAESRHVLRWFGSLSYNSFSTDEVADWKVSVIERMVRLQRENARVAPVDYECREDDCHALLEPTYRNARERLDEPEWCDRVGKESVRRLQVAADWLAGMDTPPPGMRHPRTQGQGREALDKMYALRYE
jgi:hypothetical protein